MTCLFSYTAGLRRGRLDRTRQHLGKEPVALRSRGAHVAAGRPVHDAWSPRAPAVGGRTFDQTRVLERGKVTANGIDVETQLGGQFGDQHRLCLVVEKTKQMAPIGIGQRSIPKIILIP
jgi:hypothetical protein